jgi:para-nitrobenzyl esterase
MEKRYMMKKAPILFLLFWSAILGRTQVVNTIYGAVQGQIQDGVSAFLGIPYASPPVGPLRWAPPQPHGGWSEVRLAQAFPPACPQKEFSPNDTLGKVVGQEDCLYLNVWTPSLSGRLPVMVFIHGGGNQQGSTGQMTGGARIYDGKNLAKRGGVVVVTIQYRLGALGYLVHPGLEAESAWGKAGNYGAMDHLAALQWVRQNIEAFGGDPERVTIFGESAGAVNVGNLLVMPAAKGLFHRAILQSGSPRLKGYNVARTEGIAFAQKLGATGAAAQQIAYLRSLPADSLVRDDSSPISGNGITQAPWQPVMDGYWFAQEPLEVIQNDQHNRVPLLIGSNSEEMSLYLPPVITPQMFQAFVQASIPPVYRPQVLATYPPGSTNEQARASYVALVSDLQFTAPARRVADCVSKNQTEPVWRYFFTFRHTVPVLQPFGAYHGMELFYVFNTWENAVLGSGPLFRPADDSVQQNLLRYWTNFARTGDPNGAGLVGWPQYASPADCYLELKATPNGSQCGVRTAESNLWDQIVGFVPCKSTISVHGMEDASGGWRLYPNPASDRLYLSGPADPAVRVWWFDALGRLLWTSTPGETSFDLSALPAGLYVAHVISQWGSQVQWVVRQ